MPDTLTTPDTLPSTDLRLKLDGMTCASCVARAERVLKAVQRVEGDV